MTDNCRECKDELFQGENCFGDPETREKICMACFEEMTTEQRKGIVPVSRTVINQYWIDYCAKYGLRP